MKGSKIAFEKFLKENGLFKKNRKGKKEQKEQRSLSFYLSRSFKELKKSRGGNFIFLLFLAMASTIVGLAIPWTSKIMIDYILPKSDVYLLAYFAIILFIIAIIRYIIQISYDFYVEKMVGRFSIALKRKVMKHLYALPLIELQKLKTGGAVTRLQDDTEGAANLIKNALLTPINAGFMLIFSIISLLLVSWQVTIISLGFIIGMFAISYFFFYLMRPFQRAIREDLSRINGSLTESFLGIEVVKSCGKEKNIISKFMRDTHLLWRKNLYTLLIGLSVRKAIFGIHFVATIFIWLIGGYLHINGQLSIGDIVMFSSFLIWIFQPVFMIMTAFSETQRSMACMERTIDLLEIPREILENKKTNDIKSFGKDIVFEDVSFKYPDGTLALDSINLKIPKGKMTALVGASGSGKTTITSLLLRFYKITTGEIKLDGQNISDISLSSYRSLISLVTQDVFLFDGSIYDNILFGNKNATKNEIEYVAQLAHCDEFINKLEKKYDTLIGERGVKLSGGQKQRLALARALIADPELLILDEATSNLDSESEALIQDALKHIFQSRTSLVIAHRLSTIYDADNIIVLENGKILEQGTHEGLIKKQGKYYSLVQKQIGNSNIFPNKKVPDKVNKSLSITKPITIFP